MRIIDGEICSECNINESAVICDGCGKILCKECRIFEIWGYGCGHADSKAFCKTCYNDPGVNPWRAGQ